MRGIIVKPYDSRYDEAMKAMVLDRIMAVFLVVLLF